MYERHSNGVRVRADGCGDAWAQAHRKLGPTFNMQDIDALFGIMAFGQNTGDKLFLEYVPDDYRNRGKAVRDFRVIAMFDRKSSRQATFIGDGEIQARCSGRCLTGSPAMTASIKQNPMDEEVILYRAYKRIVSDFK